MSSCVGEAIACKHWARIACSMIEKTCFDWPVRSDANEVLGHPNDLAHCQDIKVFLDLDMCRRI